ncbi:unnamed protein product [Linum trigynum]|uniref:KIB1-4 beta-propeller domain-containing protein n=1 Tax=Linum trigynum TaxID=586398 RepID=A0AAV2DPB3_9ROSI
MRNRMMMSREVGAWSDLCPDLLESIYGNLLNPVHAMEFGSVCRSWRQIHASLQAQPRGRVFGGVRLREIRCQEARDKLLRGGEEGYEVYSWASGWWLLASLERNVLGCFNDFLSWPSSFIPLPPGLNFGSFSRFDGNCTSMPIKAAFSAPPAADGDWTMLILHSISCFSTFRPGQDEWCGYLYPHIHDRVCVGIGYRDRRFFCLFSTGDVLIVKTDHGRNPGSNMCEWRMMLASEPILTPRDLLASALSDSNFHVVLFMLDECGGGRRVVISWERRDDTAFFRLLRVEKELCDVRDEGIAIFAVGERWMQGDGLRERLEAADLESGGRTSTRPAEEESTVERKTRSAKGNSIIRVLSRWFARGL